MKIHKSVRAKRVRRAWRKEKAFASVSDDGNILVFGNTMQIRLKDDFHPSHRVAECEIRLTLPKKRKGRS